MKRAPTVSEKNHWKCWENIQSLGTLLAVCVATVALLHTVWSDSQSLQCEFRYKKMDRLIELKEGSFDVVKERRRIDAETTKYIEVWKQQLREEARDQAKQTGAEVISFTDEAFLKLGHLTEDLYGLVGRFQYALPGEFLKKSQSGIEKVRAIKKDDYQDPHAYREVFLEAAQGFIKILEADLNAEITKVSTALKADCGD